MPRPHRARPLSRRSRRGRLGRARLEPCWCGRSRDQRARRAMLQVLWRWCGGGAVPTSCSTSLENAVIRQSRADPARRRSYYPRTHGAPGDTEDRARRASRNTQAAGAQIASRVPGEAQRPSMPRGQVREDARKRFDADHSSRRRDRCSWQSSPSLARPPPRQAGRSPPCRSSSGSRSRPAAWRIAPSSS